jgi:hypothetical protein
MTSRSSSKFLSRASVGDVVSYAYDLLTAAGQVINPVKSPSTTRTYDNESSVRAFKNAVSVLLTVLYLVLINYHPGSSSRRASSRTMNLVSL